MTTRWVTPLLGTGPYMELHPSDPTINVLDVRDIVDKAGNSPKALEKKIKAGQALLSHGKKVVVCCDYGISRSSAIVAGILALVGRVSLDAATEQVIRATGETEIKLDVLQAVRAALGDQIAPSTQSAQKTVLITGGSGFIGRPLATTLRNDMRVIAPTHKTLDLERGSTPIDVVVGQNDVGTVVHLANPKVYTSNAAMGTSITMLRNTIDVCVARDVPLVFLSSWEIYSGYRGELIANESLPALPRGPYGETKLLCEAMIEHSRQQSGLRCAVIRSGPVYGPGGDRPKFIYNFLDKARTGEAIVTHRYRNGDPAMDMLYIDDLVNLIAQVVRTGFSGTINAGTGSLTSTYDAAHMLADLVGSKSRVERTCIETDTARIAMDASRAFGTFGWKPAISFLDGISTLVSHDLLGGVRK